MISIIARIVSSRLHLAFTYCCAWLNLLMRFEITLGIPMDISMGIPMGIPLEILMGIPRGIPMI